MTHDDLARELYQKEQENITPVKIRDLRLYDDDGYFCGSCNNVIDHFGASYCWNCGKKLDWKTKIKIL